MAIKVPIVTTYDPRGTKRAQSGIGKFASYAKAAFAGIALASAAAIGKLGMDSIKAASNYEESLSKVNVIFGETGKRIEEFAATASSTFGQSATQALDAASTFATFGKAAGLEGRNLASFSEELTVLSSDLASFYNTDVEEAITAIGSALRGEAEPIRRFGVLLDDATLRAQAFEMGLIDSTKNALTPQQKSLAAYQTILKQTGDAQGDFERTSDGLANSQRTLSATWEDIQIQIGQALLPTFTGFVEWLKTDGISGIQAFIDTLTGKEVTGTEWTAKNGKIERSLSPIQKSFKNLGTAVLDIGDGFAELFKTLEIDDPDGAFFTFVDGVSQLVKLGAQITRFGKGFIGESFGWEDLSLFGKTMDLTDRLFGSLFGSNSPGSAPSRASGQTVINVNGGVLDPEGTARAIQRVLTQSQRRAGAY
jgi:hypothetical protein